MAATLINNGLSRISCKITLTAVTIAAFVHTLVEASAGDRSWIFQKCLYACQKTDCRDEHKYRQSQPLYMQLLQWSCIDECKYDCMWKTVDAFHNDNSNVPQFYGKWPFVRLWGMQEPASVVFSLLNGLGHLGIFYFQSKVPKSTPMYYVWHGSAIISANAWFWSMVFHTRDKDFTEMMDYFCAFSLVVYTLFAFGCRVLDTKKRWRIVILGICLGGFYLSHIAYLGLVKFDYGYNMKVNIATGFVNMCAWLLWCYRHRRKQPYVIKCAFVIIGLNIMLLLEVFDLPPYLWVFDAHSLWHAGTIPLLYPWYSFLTDDCLYLHTREQEDIYKLD
ncbi:post-GPI attachment to proteins factor 3-like [Gigantopelta aegis]|uniref:post-GPI attachment to proteins factor 3-like n=1 Tax=Gigantopelta aegis TaxID=1735272 RepID=UPI001B8894B4|nr:post-GPI attachment to proteins factor 3-like [Gigantopelta aegis]